jgi:hypothetical protein
VTTSKASPPASRSRRQSDEGVLEGIVRNCLGTKKSVRRPGDQLPSAGGTAAHTTGPKHYPFDPAVDMRE